MTLRDDFEHGIRRDHWPQVYGADTAADCDVVVSGQSLTFYKVCVTLGSFFRVYFLNAILKAETHEPTLAADTDGGNWGTENAGPSQLQWWKMPH